VAGDDKIPSDPVSALLAAATTAHELFATFVTSGFTEQQALYLVGQILAASQRQ
jgi:hypothetical protein